MMLVDTHCHLASARLCDELPRWLAEAEAAEVRAIINVGYDLESSRCVISQLAGAPALFAAVGIQPHDASSFCPEAAEAICNLAKTNPRVVAVGEIGLDGFHKLSPMEEQIACYRHFLAMASELNLPVIVHMRDTFDDVIAGLRSEGAASAGGVIHCFSGTVDEARAFLDLGFYLSLSGMITFKSRGTLADVARFIPLDRLLVETDAPYLAPVPFRGQLNRPAWVVHTVREIAQLRQVDPALVAAATTRNAQQLFRRMCHDNSFASDR